jgi:putative thioredoxin
LASIHAARQQTADALALLERISPGPLRAPADRLAAELRIQTAADGDEPALRAEVAAHPDDLDARLRLAQILAAAANYDEALAAYLEIVHRDRDFHEGAARKAMLDVFELLGSGHPLVDRYRSELAKVLFS